MAKSNPEKFLALEDQIIAYIEPQLSASFESLMEQILVNYEQTQSLTVPLAASNKVMLDILSQAWEESISLGVGEFDMMSGKQDNGLNARTLVAYIRQYGARKINRIATTTVTQITKIITDGQRQGKTPGEIAKALSNSLPRIAKQRAKLIAVTEVHSATQYGLYRSAILSQKPLDKIWQTMEDDRVRSFAGNATYSHRAMQNTRTPLQKKFLVPHVGGSFEGLLFPGDPDGSAGNVINCRCLMTFEEK